MTWFTEIDTKNEDYIAINLAKELELVFPNGVKEDDRFSYLCEGINGVTKCSTERDKDNANILYVTLDEVDQ
jgi:hypothetical protein